MERIQLFISRDELCRYRPLCYRQRHASWIKKLGESIYKIKCCVMFFSGNSTPTHPIVTLITLNRRPYIFITFFSGNSDTLPPPTALSYVTLEWPQTIGDIQISKLMHCSAGNEKGRCGEEVRFRGKWMQVKIPFGYRPC